MNTPADPTFANLPPLPPEDADLFNLLARHDFDLAALARETGRPLTDLLRWFFQPPIQRYLDALQRAAEIAVQLTAARARPTALTTLHAIAAASDDPLERRRAATTLAVHSRPPRPQRAPAPTSAESPIATTCDPAKARPEGAPIAASAAADPSEIIIPTSPAHAAPQAHAPAPARAAPPIPIAA